MPEWDRCGRRPRIALGFIDCTRRSAGAKQRKRPSTIQRDEHNTQEGFR